jgi:phage shock protein PspC (stress-responsive transcriptional regulator)
MKKTLTINLNSNVFHIDEDAFQCLKNYLNAVDKHFPNSEEKEILRDIEARIAELFNEKLSASKSVIEIADVEEVISILGQPNQFGGEDEKSDENAQKENEKQQEKPKNFARKLYRDPDKKVFGGVLAGIAAYFGFDVVWMRILAVAVVMFGFGTPIVLYIIAWVVMPEAKTAAQKLEMRGEEVTVDSIKNFFESEQFHENANQIGSKFGEVVMVIAKILFVFIGIIGIITGFCIIFGLLIGAVALFFSDKWLVFDYGTMGLHTLFWAGIIFLLLIPATGMFIGGLRLVKNRKNLQKTRRSGIFGWFMLVIWITSLLVVIACAVKAENLKYNLGIGRNKGELVTENRLVSGFKAVEIGNGINVDFIKSDTVFVKISSGKNILKDIRCEVKDSVLYLKSERRHNFFNRYDIRVKIGIKKIENIVAKNGCNISALDTIFAEKLTMNFANGCKIDIYAKADEIKMYCSNGCDVDTDFSGQSVSMNFSNACKINSNIKSSSVFADFSNACAANLTVNSDNLQINAGNACDIDIQGITKKLTTNKNNGSKINTENLSQVQ